MEEYLRATAIADHMIQASDSLFGWTITRIYVGPFAFSFRAAPTDLRRTSAPSTGAISRAERFVRKNIRAEVF